MKKLNDTIKINCYFESFNIPFLDNFDAFVESIKNNIKIPKEDFNNFNLYCFIENYKKKVEFNELIFYKFKGKVKEIFVENKDISFHQVLNYIQPTIDSLKIKCYNLESELNSLKKEYSDYKNEQEKKNEDFLKMFTEKVNSQMHKMSSFNILQASNINGFDHSHYEPIENNRIEEIIEEEKKEIDVSNIETINNNNNNNNDNNNNNNIKQSIISIFDSTLVVNPKNEKEEEIEIKGYLKDSVFQNYIKDQNEELKNFEKKDDSKNEEEKDDSKDEKKEVEKKFEKKDSMMSAFYDEFLK